MTQLSPKAASCPAPRAKASPQARRMRLISTAWQSAVVHRAEQVLGSEAAGWMQTPNLALAGMTPFDLAADKLGAEMVIAELARLGVAADRPARPGLWELRRLR